MSQNNPFLCSSQSLTFSYFYPQPLMRLQNEEVATFNTWSLTSCVISEHKRLWGITTQITHYDCYHTNWCHQHPFFRTMLLLSFQPRYFAHQHEQDTHFFPRGLNWWLTNGTTRLFLLSLPVCVNITRVFPLHYLELAVSIRRDSARPFPLHWFALVVSQDSAKVSLVISH